MKIAKDLVGAASSEEFLSSIRAIDLSVAARTEGRTTDQTEIYTACHLLATLAHISALEFPVRVTHRDKPDFELRSGDRMIGIEVTEGISTDYARYCALAEQEFPGVPLDPDYFRHGQPKISLKKLRELLSRSQSLAKPWMGDRPEKEWALYMRDALEEKLKKLASPKFDKFEENWLSIYDNLPLTGVHLQEAVTNLMPFLAEHWTRDPHFDVIFIERGPVIARITSAGSTHLLLHDLWD